MTAFTTFTRGYPLDAVINILLNDADDHI